MNDGEETWARCLRLCRDIADLTTLHARVMALYRRVRIMRPAKNELMMYEPDTSSG